MNDDLILKEVRNKIKGNLNFREWDFVNKAVKEAIVLARESEQRKIGMNLAVGGIKVIQFEPILEIDVKKIRQDNLNQMLEQAEKNWKDDKNGKPMQTMIQWLKEKIEGEK